MFPNINLASLKSIVQSLFHILNITEVNVNSLRIMLVDDNNNFRNSAIRYINANLRFEMLTWVSSGEEAIKAVNEKAIDLIIMDISMPGINGIEAARIIKGSNKDIKIILLALSDSIEYRNEMLSSGANEFIHKIEFTDRLIPVINKMFSGNAA
jgi:DNA-binding NarL/FixJ family response regulator